MGIFWNKDIADSEVAVKDETESLIEKKDREMKSLEEKKDMAIKSLTEEKNKEIGNLREKRKKDEEERKKEMSCKNDEILKWMRRCEQCERHCNYLKGERQRLKRRLDILEDIERKRVKKEEDEEKRFQEEEAIKRKVRIKVEERRRLRSNTTPMSD